MEELRELYEHETGKTVYSFGDSPYTDWLEKKLAKELEVSSKMDKILDKTIDEVDDLYEKLEEIVDIIDSENSGLSAEDRLNEIVKEIYKV